MYGILYMITMNLGLFFYVKASKNKYVIRTNETGNDVQIVDCW